MQLHRYALAALAALALDAAATDLFSYSTPDGKSGLRLAWRSDSTAAWQPLGNNLNFVSSDFGPWGSHKKMHSPRLFVNAADGQWTCVWDASATGDGTVTALAVSPDLTKWEPQRYFASPLDLPHDMRPENTIVADSAVIDGIKVGGYRQTADMRLIDRLKEYVADRERLGKLHSQHAKDDATRFASLGAVTFDAKANPAEAKEISDKLIGIFFEDINYAADGGLYGELIQNRDFEYTPSDRKGEVTWNSRHSWDADGDGTFSIKTSEPIHPNNPHYASIQGPLTLTNFGYDGITVRKGEKYLLSVAVRSIAPVTIPVTLTDSTGKVLARASFRTQPGTDWKKYSATLKASSSASGAHLNLEFPRSSSADVDMVSLFPADTYKGRPNGMRRDLAQTLADLKPKFVRFPGGCVAHGNGIDNIYDWKGSIGALEARKPLRNLWNYHQTRGLGYHEYFLFCEDLGAEPLPVLSAGVPCQNSGIAAHHSHEPLTTLGQQCGIPMEEMGAYVQDILDLIEYANGDVSTTWGARRAAAGHPEPFNLKYIGIGNEDLISEVFIPRFKMIFDAIKATYPEITVVGTVGPFYEGSDYDAGWKLAEELGIPMVDEHYYVDPSWMIHNQDYYDNYRRNGTKVYLGEYAAHLPGRPSNMETALAEALYLTSVERNADVVAMTSYAPLLAKQGHTQWRPDLIYFNNDSVMPTTDYHVQKMFGNNSGDMYIPAMLSVSDSNPDVKNRFGLSIVHDSTSGKDGDYIVKLVNMLPVEVSGNLDLSPLGVTASEVTAEQLAGSPADTDTTPVKTVLTLPSVTLPPYSFTLFRVRGTSR
ncbi:MAG: carbohydrate binding domain-containing protein [Duncaniella sp.]|nr:carbohydrate binding domain-containing protein [Duncaniella sp.]